MITQVGILFDNCLTHLINMSLQFILIYCFALSFPFFMLHFSIFKILYIYSARISILLFYVILCASLLFIYFTVLFCFLISVFTYVPLQMLWKTHLEHVRLKQLITIHNKTFTDCLEVFICMLHPHAISVKYCFCDYQTSILHANL